MIFRMWSTAEQSHNNTQKSIVTIAILYGQFVEDNGVLNEAKDWDLWFREENIDSI